MEDYKHSAGDSDNHADCPTKARDVITDVSTDTKDVNKTSGKSREKDIAVESRVRENRKDQQKKHRVGEHVCESDDGTDSVEYSDSDERGKTKSIKTSKKVTSKRSGARGRDGNLEAVKGTSLKGYANGKERSGAKSKVRGKTDKEIINHNRSSDDASASRNSSHKNSSRDTRSENKQLKSSLEDSSRTSDVRKASADSSNKFTVADGSTMNSSSRISRSRKKNSSRSASSSSNDNYSRNQNSRSRSPNSNSSRRSNSQSSRIRSSSSSSNSSERSSSQSSSSRSNRSRSNKSRSNSSRSTKLRSNSSSRSSCRSGSSESRKNRSYSPITANGSSYLKNDRYASNSIGSNHSEDQACKSEMTSKEHGPSHPLHHSQIIGPAVFLEYEWQYRNDEGGWATYGHSGGNLPGTKMVTSDDIEKYYFKDPDKTPLMIEFNNNNYILDFQRMKQTSQRTSNQRDIRRILKIPTYKDAAKNGDGRAASGRSGATDYSFNAGNGGGDRKSCYENSTFVGPNFSTGNEGDPVTYEWQFKNKDEKWIAYGSGNTFFNKSKATTSKSDDIEKAYSNRVNFPYFEIESNRYSYILDFNRMIQTNNETEVERQIRRVVKETAKKGVAKYVGKVLGNLTGQKSSGKEVSTPYEWQFLDEHGIWITYGRMNSAAMVDCTTSTTSDDIEKFYNSKSHKQVMNIKSANNQYNLDLKNMTQTNIITSIERPIRRVLNNRQDDNEVYHKLNTEVPRNKQSRDNPSSNYNQNTEVPRDKLSRDDHASNYNVNTETARKMQTQDDHEAYYYLNAEVGGNFEQDHNSSYDRPGTAMAKSSSAHVWQFEDEYGAWITYGESSSAVMGSGVTTASTDDIEDFYLANKGEMPMFVGTVYNDYILDFQTMRQTNQSTYAQRRIRRIPKDQLKLIDADGFW